MLKRFLFLVIILSLSFPASIFACGGSYDEEDMQISLFRPDILELKGAGGSGIGGSLYHSWQGTDAANNLEEGNYRDWMNHIKGSTKDDVRDLVYSLDMIEHLIDFMDALVNNEPAPERMMDNKIAKYIWDNKDYELLEYLIFSKEVAILFDEEESTWAIDGENGNTFQELLDEAEKAFGQATNNFIKARYGFQIVRIHHLLGQYADAIAFYEKNLKGQKLSQELDEWSRSFYAGSLIRNNRLVDGFKESALVFANSERYRNAGFRGCSIVIQNIPDMEIILNSLDGMNEEEKGAALAVLALNSTFYSLTDGADASSIINLLSWVKDGHQVSPEVLALVMSRVLTDLEAGALNVEYVRPTLDPKLSKEYSKYYADTASKTAVRIKQFEELILPIRDNMAKPGNYLSPGSGEFSERNDVYWGIVAAYLSLLRMDYDTTKERLAWADSRNQNTKMQKQIKVLELANNALLGELDAKNEEELYRGLSWMLSSVKRDADFESGNSIESKWLDRSAGHILLHILAPRYDNKNMAAKSFYSTANAYSKTKTYGYYSKNISYQTLQAADELSLIDLKAVEDFPRNARSEFDTFLASGLNPEFNLYKNDMEIVKRLREHDFEGAALMTDTTFPKDRYSFTAFPSAIESWVLFFRPTRLNNAYPIKDTTGYDTFTSDKLITNVTKLDDKTLAEAIGFSNYLFGSSQETGAAKQSEIAIQNLVNLVNSPVETRASFAQHMYALEILSKLFPGKEGEAIRLLYANGLFSMSFYGKGCYLTMFTVSGSPYLSAQYGLESLSNDFYSNKSASEAFEKLAVETSDRELAARALFMASLANQGLDEVYGWSGEAKTDYVINNKYFEKMQSTYGDTKFFKSAKSSCSYFNDYLSRH